MLTFKRLPFFILTLSYVSIASYAATTEITKTSQKNKNDILADVEVSEVIVVTGSRQQSSLLALAGNIDRISSKDIALVSSVHPSDILNRATGVHVQTNNGMESLPSLRSPVLTGPGAAGAFLFLEEGIATRSAGFANNNGLSELNLAQAQEVEIIRGPASAVYGSNAVHGVVNVLTKAPSDGGDMTLLAGPNNRYQFQGTIGRELNKHGISGNIQAIDDGGYRDNSGFKSLKLGLRHDYANGVDQFKTLVSGFVLDQDTAGYISSSNNGTDCYSSSYSKNNLYKDRNAMEKNCDTGAYREWSSVRIASSWQRELSAERSFTITPYFRINQMEFRQHYLPSKAIEENSHYSIGMVNSYNWQVEKNITLVTGVDLEWTEGELTQTQQKADSYNYGKARQQGLHYDYEVAASTIAPYFQADWQLTQQLKCTGSVRFDVTKYRYDNLIADGTTKADGSSCTDGNGAPVECLYKRPSDSTDSFDNSSAKLGFNYRLNNDMAFFGSWSQGFRSPQVTDMYRLQNQQLVGEIGSEQLDSSELGLRGVSKKLTYEVAIYYMSKNNFFFRDVDGLNVTDGKTSHQGLELSINYDLTEQLNLAVNYSYGQHEYEFNQASSDIVKGNAVDTAPEQLANVRLAWQATESSKLELEWLHMGEYYLDPANEHKYAGHDLLQLRGLIALNNNIHVFARIENITDEKYASRADYAYGSYRFFGGQPRALHLGVSISF
ncbi:ligand-gated channel [Thalassotalea sp. 42_200_T64]|nr:ligand-gated channel [Thalassotalea sp. 42_200_T64]